MASVIGMGGSVASGSTAVPVSVWQIAGKNEAQDVTDTGSSGWLQFIAGCSSGTLTFTAFWGKTGSVLSTTFNIGSIISFTGTLGGGGGTVTGSFIITDFTIKNDAKTPITFECTAQSSGAITWPS